MATFDELQTAVAAVQAGVASLTEALATAKAAQPDFQAQVDALNAAVTEIDAALAPPPVVLPLNAE